MRRWTVELDTADELDATVVGGKAWSLWRMTRLGVRVPPALVITVDACREFFERQESLPAGLEAELDDVIKTLEEATGRSFGSGPSPLLLSVRSGAPISMPGMMDTVLNLGMNDEVEDHLARETGLPAFAADTHRRFCDLFATTVLGVRLEEEQRVTARSIREAVASYGSAVPSDPRHQLTEAVTAVFRSWNSRRAGTYRSHYGISDSGGTAVTIQAMVFGNLGEDSGTGVLFTRDPRTGEPNAYGEYLAGGQGEDVVSGSHTPKPLDALQIAMPDAYAELMAWSYRLEAEQRDVQDIEFTVQGGIPYLLQCRAAKRSAAAALRIAMDLVDEGLIDVDEALGRVSPEQARSILRPHVTRAALDGATVLARGLGASHGVGQGLAVSDPDEVVARHAAGEDVVLVRATTSPHDIHGMLSARAIVTGHGGTTSHAAVVGRAVGKPCVVSAGEHVLADLPGRMVTVDGDHGVVYDGLLELEFPDEHEHPYLARLVAWAKDRAPVSVVSPVGALELMSVVDLDEHYTVEHGLEHVAGLVATADAVRGEILNTDDGVRAAVRAGARALVTENEAPTLLAALSVTSGRG